VLAAFVAARSAVPTAQLIIAPRYLERCAEVQAIVERAGLHAVRRSALTGAPTTAPVILLDTMGELARCYGLARVAFVGGSLVPRGGQNMLEPVALGVPVVVGPRTEHAADQVALLAGRGLVQIDGLPALEQQLTRLLGEPATAAALGAQAQAALAAATGAARRCADQLLPLLPTSATHAT
jgi:3-deoxy-D-manno-octulosonic-acid transferase